MIKDNTQMEIQRKIVLFFIIVSHILSSCMKSISSCIIFYDLLPMYAKISLHIWKVSPMRITMDRSLLHPIAADNAPITSDCSQLHFFAADCSVSQRKCNPLWFAV